MTMIRILIVLVVSFLSGVMTSFGWHMRAGRWPVYHGLVFGVLFSIIPVSLSIVTEWYGLVSCFVQVIVVNVCFVIDARKIENEVKGHSAPMNLQQPLDAASADVEGRDAESSGVAGDGVGGAVRVDGDDGEEER